MCHFRGYSRRWTAWRIAIIACCPLACCLGSAGRPGSAAPLDIEEPLAPLEERQAATSELQLRLHAAALFAAGRMLEQRGEAAGALRKYQRAYRYDPTPTVLEDILRLAAELERYDEAVRYALLAADTLPADAKLLRPLALVLTQQGDWRPALALYEVMLRQSAAESDDASAPPDFTELTIRQEAIRLYFLTGQFADGAKICATIEAALAEPEKFRLTTEQQQELLGEPALTYHLLAECHLAAGAFDAATRCFETAHQHQPNAGLLGYNLARVENRRGRAEQALQHLQAYFTNHLAGEGAAPYTLLGDLLTALGQATTFDERLDALRTADPVNAALALFVAQRHLAAEKFELAEPMFAALAQTAKQRRLDDVYTGLITCRWKLGQLEPLLAALGDTEAKASADVLETSLGTIADDAKLRGQLIELARQRRSPAASKLPPANESWTIAELALAGKDLPTALEFFEFALQDQPQRRGELLETFGVALFLADHTQESATVFRRGMEDEKLSKERTSFQFYLAGALAMLGQTDEALAIARLAEAAEPKDPRYAMRVAWILQRAKRRDEALATNLALLKQFANRYKSSATRDALGDVRQSISSLYVQRGERTLAKEYLEQILDEFPAHAGALNDLGYLWAETGQHLAIAKQMIERALAAEPDNRAYLDSLGWVEYQLGNYPAARLALEKAIEGDEQPDGVILDHLGDVYLKLNERDKAKALWQRALESLPGDIDAPRQAALKQKLAN